VERCDFISAVGYGDGTPGFRDRLRLPPGGPRLIITPLCVFGFDPVSSRARLASIHPGTDVDEVRAATGFHFPTDTPIPVTAPPTDDELGTLRTRIDPQGALR
jgi:glutaconate CoA-transferase subunit B